MRASTLYFAIGSLVAIPDLALAQAAPATPLTTPVITRNGGFPGTSFGAAGAGAGATSATVGNRARSGEMISGASHIGAGTGGLGLGMGNAVGGIRDTALGAGTGGLTLSLRSNTGGVTGAGGGSSSQTGGIKDNQGGINTGGVNGSAIGAGVGGIYDLNTLAASTGGTKEGNNAPRYRVVQ